MNLTVERRTRKAVIAGAGPAGSSLAIRLARSGLEVTLIERSFFPRRKLCGEFISPECLEHFKDLGVLADMMSAGGDRIAETVFFSMKGRSASVPSDWFGAASKSALGLSRAEMDLRLLEKARCEGVEIIEGAAVNGIVREEDLVKAVTVRLESGERVEVEGDIFADATGRARALARHASGEEASRPRLVGFKSHFSGVEMPSGRCEIYFFPGGYGGLNYVEDGLANHCFLVRADVVRSFGGDTDSMVDELVLSNIRARQTLGNAKKQFDWLAVAVDGFGPKELVPAPNLFAVGDAGAFIDPFTGSGMLMALESSDLLAKALVRGANSLETAAEGYRADHRSKFARRLRLCAVMRRIAYLPMFAGAAVSAVGLSSTARKLLARSTRKGAEAGGSWFL